MCTRAGAALHISFLIGTQWFWWWDTRPDDHHQPPPTTSFSLIATKRRCHADPLSVHWNSCIDVLILACSCRVCIITYQNIGTIRAVHLACDVYSYRRSSWFLYDKNKLESGASVMILTGGSCLWCVLSIPIHVGSKYIFVYFISSYDGNPMRLLISFLDPTSDICMYKTVMYWYLSARLFRYVLIPLEK